MNLDSLIDFANEATDEIGKYKVSFILSSPKIQVNQHIIPVLHWESVKYGNAELNKVPDDKRGIYAFSICQHSDVLPPHGYILYIGIAGYRSNRSLRERYKDYLNEKQVFKRANIARMIGTWHGVLRFLFAPVSDDFSSDDLKKLEKQLNTALMPPFSENDLEADINRKRRAFR